MKPIIHNSKYNENLSIDNSNGKVKRIAINTGISNSKIIEIVSQGIKSGDSIITEGQIFLNNGEKVNIAK